MTHVISSEGKTDPAPLRTLFFVQAHANALWYLPFSNVLRAHGLEAITPYAFACPAIAAFLSPMLAGALTDHRYAGERVLRWLALGTAAFLALTFAAIDGRWGAGWVLVLLQIYALCAAPTWGIATAIVLARLRQPEREFGPIRVWATFGWMAAGPLLSFVLHADASTLSGYTASAVWLSVALWTLWLPAAPPLAGHARGWRSWLGLDALELLRDRDHRAVFLGAALFSIPLAAFYPFSPMQLRDLGETNVSAAMSLAQVTEVAAMYALAILLARLRLKMLFLVAIGAGVIRYALFALDAWPWLIAGITLHGICFTLFFIPAQIYLERRIDPRFRGRAQALLVLMVSGVGTLAGALGCGWWREWCAGPDGTRWAQYWWVLSAATLGVFAFFAASYRGGGASEEASMTPPISPADYPTARSEAAGK